MRATHRLGAAIVALIVAVALTGCIKFDADLTVTSDDTVDGTFVVGVNKQLLALSGQDAASITDQIRSGVESDAPEQGDVSAEPYEDDTFVGATVTFSGVPLEEINIPGAGDNDADTDLSISREGDQYKVAGELDFAISDLRAPGIGNVDEILANAEPEVSIAITFPGRVTQANGSIDGCTVSWEPSLTEATTFEATADDSGGCREGLKWWAWILIGIGVLVLIGAIVAVVRTIRKDNAKRSGMAAAAPSAPAPAADDLPPESTPLTMAPSEPPSSPGQPEPAPDAGALPPPGPPDFPSSEPEA